MITLPGGVVPNKLDFDTLTKRVAALESSLTALDGGLKALIDQHNLLVAEVVKDEDRIKALEATPVVLPPIVPPVVPPPVIPPVVIPPLTGLPDPMLLPAAVDQAISATYAGLNIPSMVPGDWYLDPITGVTIVKLTTPTAPVPGVASLMCGVDYASGGCRIGRPTNGVYPIIVMRNPGTSGDYHVITFNPTTRAVGYRGPAPGQASREISRAMSSVTPNVMYAFGGGMLHKYDISGSMFSEVVGGVWPKDWSAHFHGATRFVWLQSTADDRYFAAQAGDAGPFVVVWDSQTDTFSERSFSTNEFKMSKDSPYIHNTTTFDVWNVLANTVATISGMSGVYPSHSDTTRQYVFGSDVNAVHPGLWYADLESPSPARVSPNETYYIANLYSSGAWVDQASDTTQWVTQAYQTFDGVTSYSNEKMEPGSIGMIRLDNAGGLRLLCHTYNDGDVNTPTAAYYTNSLWPNMAPDGKFCLFKSNMGSKGGFASLFAAILPVKEAPVVIPPPPPVVTAPLTVSDLTVIAATDTSLSVRFTEVSDGAGLPASYEIRSTPGVMAWGSAVPAGELTGQAIGAPRVFVLTNLTPGTNYQVQLVAYRGTLNVDAVFGDLSNVASGTTGLVAVPPPPSVGEPILGAAIPILADNFDAYTAPQSYVESDKWWPWLVPSEPLSAYGVVPGRTGKAIQLNYTVGNPERHLWITHPEVKPGGWYSPSSAAIAVSYGFRIHKNGGPGGSPGYGSTNKGMKWFELWRQDQSDRGQFGPTAGNAQTGPLWHFHPAGSTLLAGFQPVGPYWNQLNDAQWHRVTYLVKPSAVRGDLTGIARMWVDGQKIVDVSAPAIGVTPPGGTKVWCTDAEVRALDTMPIGRLHLGEYMNGVLGDGVTDLPMTLEFDDFAWWVA